MSAGIEGVVFDLAEARNDPGVARGHGAHRCEKHEDDTKHNGDGTDEALFCCLRGDKAADKNDGCKNEKKHFFTSLFFQKHYFLFAAFSAQSAASPFFNLSDHEFREETDEHKSEEEHF